MNSLQTTQQTRLCSVCTNFISTSVTWGLEYCNSEGLLASFQMGKLSCVDFSFKAIDRRRVELKLFGYNFKTVVYLLQHLLCVSPTSNLCCDVQHKNSYHMRLSAIWQPLGEHCHFLINLDTKNVLSNTSYNLASLIIIRQRASFLIFLVGLCKVIEGQTPSHLWFLAFPTLGKWFPFKLLYLCMHHNNPLITKRNLRFFEM